MNLIGYAPQVRPDVVVATEKPATVRIELVSAAVELGEITIQPTFFSTGRQADVSTQSISNEEIRRAPGGNEDVVRAVAVLPGVA